MNRGQFLHGLFGCPERPSFTVPNHSLRLLRVFAPSRETLIFPHPMHPHHLVTPRVDHFHHHPPVLPGGERQGDGAGECLETFLVHHGLERPGALLPGGAVREEGSASTSQAATLSPRLGMISLVTGL